MSSNVAISLKNISKCYHIFENPKDRLKQSFTRKRKLYKEFWAMKNVSFDLKKGESIGIIGKNGSGKSTLLQIVAGTLQQTSGQLDVNGRVAALLELGSGFNPEFTGRENVIMNGVIMGLTQNEIEERMSIIEEFADIGYFIDQPVKVYSSGMFVRLAFACAINVDPDILIIDEALAVGDLQFQLKCIDKMNEFKRKGKTILFVSHDIYTVRNFCDRAIWMRDGQVHLSGNVIEVTDSFQDFMKFGMNNSVSVTTNLIEDNNNVLSIDKVSFCDENNQEQNEFLFGEKVRVVVDYTLNKPLEGLVGGIALYDKQNSYVCGLNTKLDNYLLPEQPGKYKLCLIYEDMHLMPGSYFVDVGFYESSAIVNLDYKNKTASFLVYSNNYFAEGLTYLKHKWNI
jgi:teichoic acid transport system ATP-binding protein